MHVIRPTVQLMKPSEAPIDEVVLAHWENKGWLFAKRQMVGFTTAWIIDGEITSDPQYWIPEKI